MKTAFNIIIFSVIFSSFAFAQNPTSQTKVDDGIIFNPIKSVQWKGIPMIIFIHGSQTDICIGIAHYISEHYEWNQSQACEVKNQECPLDIHECMKGHLTIVATRNLPALHEKIKNP